MSGKFKKQEVTNEQHGAVEVHMFELTEQTEGGKTGKSGLGETLVVTLVVIGAITAFCTITACAAILWKCGLCGWCPDRRRRRRSSSRSSSGGSGRKRTHGDIELGELRLKMRRLELQAAREAREEEDKEKKEELEMGKDSDVVEVPKAGLKAIMNEVGSVPELDDQPVVSMEEYSRRLEEATKMMQGIEEAKKVLENHRDNVRRGTTLGFLAGIGGSGAGAGTGGR